MAQIVADFFSVIGSDIIPPTTMQELIPYLLTIFIGIFLVASVFRIVQGIIDAMFTMRRF